MRRATWMSCLSLRQFKEDLTVPNFPSTCHYSGLLLARSLPHSFPSKGDQCCLESLAPNWGPVCRLPNFFSLCLSGVSVGDVCVGELWE